MEGGGDGGVGGGGGGGRGLVEVVVQWWQGEVEVRLQSDGAVVGGRAGGIVAQRELQGGLNNLEGGAWWLMVAGC